MAQSFPSSLERKKVALYYLFLGLLLTKSEREISHFERFHLRQALGRRLVFRVFLLVSIILRVLPILFLIPLLLTLILLGIRGVFLHQVRHGKSTKKIHDARLPVFLGIGTRLTDLFARKFQLPDAETSDEIPLETPNENSQNSSPDLSSKK